MPVTATTTLPDVDQPDLDNGVEDEIGVSWDDVINYGDYRAEYRETGADAWLDGFTTDEDTTSEPITGLEDGEEYEIRLRTETEHRTGSWTEPTSKVTKFPGLTDFDIDGTGETSVDLSWTDNADNEDGIDIERQQRYDDGWSDWETVSQLDPNTESHTEDTAVPGTEYRYRAEIYTEHVSHTTDSRSTTTDASDALDTRPGDGYYVVVEHASGSTHHPEVLSGVEFSPVLNGRPRIEIPVRKSDRWDREGFDHADLTVYDDGRILPIDTLTDVRQTEGETVLVGRGGEHLRDRVELEVDNDEAHLTAEDLISDETPYEPNVDDPAGDTQSDTLLQEGDSESDAADAFDGLSKDIPFGPTRGGVGPTPTGLLLDVIQDTSTLEYTETATDNANANYNTGVGLASAGDEIVWPVEDFEHVVPGDELDIRIRIQDSEWPVDVFLRVNGSDTLIGQIKSGDGFDIDSWNWQKLGTDDSIWGVDTDLPDLQPDDDVELVVDAGSGTDGQTDVDCIGIVDGRYDHSFSTDTNSNGYLAGPERYPPSVEGTSDDASSILAIVAGQLDLTVDGESADEIDVGLSNDQGTDWQTGTGTSLSADFDSATSTLRWRVELARYGDRDDDYPTKGYQAQTVTSWSLYADLEDTPVLYDQDYDDSLESVLNQIADYGDFIWELRRPSEDEWAIEWTQPGQRSGDVDPDVVDYEIEKSTADQYQKAVVKGGAAPIRNETFDADHGSAVELEHDGLVSGSTIVRDPDSGEVFERTVDYDLDRSAGEITTLDSGTMDDDAEHEIDYEYKVEGSYTAPDAGDDPNTLVRQIPGLTTDRACEQAALYLVQELQDPLWEGSVTISTDAAGLSLVDDLTLDELGIGEGMEIREIQQQAGELSLNLGSRQTVGELVSDISQRVESLSQRV